jgi:hypothetical protein
MDTISLSSMFGQLLAFFAGCFADRRGFENFVTLTSGWILCNGRHSPTRCIQLHLKPAGDQASLAPASTALALTLLTLPSVAVVPMTTRA